MIKLKIWDKQSDIYPPAGKKMTPEDVFAEWGWTEDPDSIVVLTMMGQTCGAIDNLEVLKSIHGVDTEDPEQAVAEIEAILNSPPPSEPTPEERIAAALEFQNLLALGDEEIDV